MIVRVKYKTENHGWGHRKNGSTGIEAGNLIETQQRVTCTGSKLIMH